MRTLDVDPECQNVARLLGKQLFEQPPFMEALDQVRATCAERLGERESLIGGSHSSDVMM
jgi:hypothetical protein